MAFTWTEERTSRQATTNPRSVSLKYTAAGTTDDLYVRAYAIANTAPMYDGLYRQDVRIDPESQNIWRVSIPYGPLSRETGQMSLSFDTTGGTVRIKVSKETVNAYPPGSPDHKGLIGVNAKGDTVDGTDIVIPALKITASFRHPAAVITLPQIKNLARYTGCTNSTTFLTFDPGEVLFLGCSGTEGTSSETTIAYQFAMSQNLANKVIGGITVAQKAGWNVAWVAYKPNNAGAKPTIEPTAIYVERVYEQINMGLALGFGA